MKTAINRLAIGLLVALPLLAETGCAQGPPVPVTADSIAMAEALSGGRKTIGVVALGSTQMMNDNWSDFDPAVRSWLAQGPTFSTLGKRGVRAPGGPRKDCVGPSMVSGIVPIPFVRLQGWLSCRSPHCLERWPRRSPGRLNGPRS